MRTLAFAAALALFAPDALAWGLETHLFFAQWVIAALPFADRELRAAALRLPGLVLAGACLPDLALAGKVLGTPAFRRAHHWSSHLVSDVIAHNQFVPEHEARIARVRHVTHAIAEFAMDEHVRGAPSRCSRAPTGDCAPRGCRGSAAARWRCSIAIPPTASIAMWRW